MTSNYTQAKWETVDMSNPEEVIAMLEQQLAAEQENAQGFHDHLTEVLVELAELREAQKRVKRFPVPLRKMWSGREVKAWIEAALLQGEGYE